MEKILELWDWAKGKRTYVVAGVMAAMTFAQAVGWLTKEQYEVIMGLLVSTGLVTTRLAIQSMKKK